MRKNHTLIICFSFLISSIAYAQVPDIMLAKSSPGTLVITQKTIETSAAGDPKNIIRINLSALIFTNFLSYHIKR